MQALSWDNPSASLMVPWRRSDAYTSIELRQSLGLTYDTLMLLKWRQNTIQILSWDNASASLMVPWCRSDVCKTQCKHWVEAIPRAHLWYPDDAQTHVKHNTHIHLRQSFGLTYGTLMSLKCVQNITNCELRQSLGLSYGTLMSLRCV